MHSVFPSSAYQTREFTRMSASRDGAAALSPATDRSFFGHPAGLSTLFFTEMWERFSYYGMRAILTLYMTKTFAEGGLAFDERYASVIYATYVSRSEERRVGKECRSRWSP